MFMNTCLSGGVTSAQEGQEEPYINVPKNEIKYNLTEDNHGKIKRSGKKNRSLSQTNL